MPNLETEQVGANILLVAGGTLIGGQTGATLNLSAGVTDINTKDTGLYRNTLEGLQSWSIDSEQLYTEDDGSHDVAADGKVQIELTYDGSTEVIKGLDTLDMSLTATPDSVGAFEDSLWEENIITGLEAEVSTSGAYFDPEATDGAAYKLLLAAQEARDTVDAVVTFDALTLALSLRPGDWSLDAPGDQSRASIDFTLLSEGTITDNTVAASLDSGLQALIDAWIAPSTVTASVEIQDTYGGSRLAGSTYWDGDVWVTGIDLSASFGDPFEVSATLTGNGPLTRNQEPTP